MINFVGPAYHSGLIVTPYDANSIGVEVTAGVNGISGTATWAANNLAMYYPWYVQEPCTVTEVAWLNGATAAGNVSVAVYDSTSALVPGAKLVGTAATAQSGTNAVQTAAVTDTVISPGLYWLAFWASSTSTTVFRTQPQTFNWFKSIGVCSETITSNLPTTATPVSALTNILPIFGVTLSPRTLV